MKENQSKRTTIYLSIEVRKVSKYIFLKVTI